MGRALRTLAAAAVLGCVLVAGLVALPRVSPEASAAVADGLQRVLGPEPVAELETLSFGLQDWLTGLAYRLTGRASDLSWASTSEPTPATTPAEPPSGTTPAEPPSGATPAEPPSGATAAEPPSGATAAETPPAATATMSATVEPATAPPPPELQTAVAIIQAATQSAASPGQAEPAAPVATRAADGAEMVFVPAGEALVGGESVRVEAFWIDRYEVTHGQYALCVAAGACRVLPAPGDDTRPASGVSPTDAAAYARWVGGRLPTEAESAKAGLDSAAHAGFRVVVAPGPPR